LRIFKYFIYDDLKKFFDIKSGSSLFKYDKYLGYALNPNYKNSSEGISINSLGFRDDEVQRQKGGSVTRIIILGDSLAFGYGDSSDTWPDKLEFLLNEKGKQNKFEVINTAVPGYTSVQVSRLLKSRLLELSPDMVIVSIGWNDLVFATYQKWYPEMSIYEWPHMKFRRRLNNFMFVKLFNEFYLRMKSFLGKDRIQKSSLNEKALISFENNLEEIARYAKNNGVEAAFLTLPTLLHNNMSEEERMQANLRHFETVNEMMLAVEKFNDIIKKVAHVNNVRIVNSQFSAFENQDKGKYFIDYCHFNKDGNEKFASEVYRILFNK
jgi:lysophospholipase L1-like esterase